MREPQTNSIRSRPRSRTRPSTSLTRPSSLWASPFPKNRNSPARSTPSKAWTPSKASISRTCIASVKARLGRTHRKARRNGKRRTSSSRPGRSSSSGGSQLGKRLSFGNPIQLRLTIRFPSKRLNDPRTMRMQGLRLPTDVQALQDRRATPSIGRHVRGEGVPHHEPHGPAGEVHDPDYPVKTRASIGHSTLDSSGENRPSPARSNSVDQSGGEQTSRDPPMNDNCELSPIHARLF